MKTPHQVEQERAEEFDETVGVGMPDGVRAEAKSFLLSNNKTLYEAGLKEGGRVVVSYIRKNILSIDKEDVKSSTLTINIEDLDTLLESALASLPLTDKK